MPDEDVTLYAYWIAKPYYVNISLSSGTISDPNWEKLEDETYNYTFTMDSENFELPIPEKTGYTFSGWEGETLGESTTKVEIEPQTVIAAFQGTDDTLEYAATYTPNPYTIQYNGNGGKLLPGLTEGTANQQTAAYDQEVQLTYGIYTRDGYTFAGWSTKENPTETEYPASGIAKNLCTGGTVTLYAVWTVTSYDAEFYLDEGSEEAYRTVNYNFDEVIAKEAVSEKEGYRFDYWYYLGENDKKVEFFTEESGNKMPVGGIKLYAHWTKEQYTIKFMDDSEELSSYTVTFGDTFSAPANPTKEGYEFAGWDWEIPAAIPDLGDYGTEKQVNAKWDIESYTLKFVDSDGTTEICEAITQSFGSQVTSPTAPEKAGYAFAGWGENVPKIMPDYGANGAVKPFAAQWEPLKYDVTVNVEAGSINAENWTVGENEGEYLGPQYTIEDKYLLPTPTRFGYEFSGWEVVSGTVVLAEEAGNYYIPVGTTGNVELIAKWSPKTIIVRLDAGEGKFENHTGEVSVVFDEAYGTLPTPVLEGYRFLGWYQAEIDDSHRVTEETVKNDEKTVLYAHWAIDSFTISFDTNGGSEIAAVTKEYGSALQVSDPTREGYVFTGWYQTESEDGTLLNPYTITTMPAANMTLYAGWNPIVYTLELDVNNGSLESSEVITYTVENTVEEIAAKLPTPVRTGYSFSKWNGMPLEGYMPAEKVRLTAEWSVNTYDLKFFIEDSHHMTLQVNYGTLLDHTYG